MNDDARGTYNTNSQIKFKTIILKSSFRDSSDAYILEKRTITIAEAGEDAVERNAVTFKNCATFTDCISRINNTQITDARDLGVVMSMYNLNITAIIMHKTPGSLWQYHNDDQNDNIADSGSFKFKARITDKNPAAGNTKDAEILE